MKDADTGLLGAFQKPLQTSNLGFLYILADTLHKIISSLTVYACLFSIMVLNENTKYISCVLLPVCMVAVAVGAVLNY